MIKFDDYRKSTAISGWNGRAGRLSVDAWTIAKKAYSAHGDVRLHWTRTTPTSVAPIP
jgi:hypothetical protein